MRSKAAAIWNWIFILDDDFPLPYDSFLSNLAFIYPFNRRKYKHLIGSQVFFVPLLIGKAITLWLYFAQFNHYNLMTFNVI